MDDCGTNADTASETESPNSKCIIVRGKDQEIRDRYKKIVSPLLEEK
jgi:hypothetical protein